MKRFPGFRTLAVLGLFVAAAAAADQNAPGGHGRMAYGGLRHVEKCVSNVSDLSASQKAAIDESLAAGRLTLKSNGEAMKALRQKMDADLAAGADKDVLGQNALDQEAARAKMKADIQSIHDQVLGQLSNEQLDQFNACAAARPRRAPPAPSTSQ